MLVAFYCQDKQTDAQALRDQHLAAHLVWVEQNMKKIQVAGPLRKSGRIVGSLYVLEAEDLDSATHCLSTDPYYQAGIWAEVQIEEFNAYAGNWVGGKNWPGAD